MQSVSLTSVSRSNTVRSWGGPVNISKSTGPLDQWLYYQDIHGNSELYTAVAMATISQFALGERKSNLANDVAIFRQIWTAGKNYFLFSRCRSKCYVFRAVSRIFKSRANWPPPLNKGGQLSPDRGQFLPCLFTASNSIYLVSLSYP